MNERSQREEAVFEAALALLPDQRAAYLSKACGEDADLRVRIEALLAAHAQTTGILETEAAHGSTSAMALNCPLTEKPGDRIGRYKLLQKIGEGGCGVVYMAEQLEPVKRQVALKVIKPGMDTRQVLARFEAERQALALMSHPNIAKVLDAGATETGRPYFVMELVRGVRITDYCDDPQNSLSTEKRLELFIQVCRAIQHAHQKGVIHRDIKPSNILVTLQEDGTPMPKVIDFGIAKATSGQTLTDKTLFTAFEQFIGTPAYMSPEQAQLTAIDIDTRSDIYSLGVLLYELLIGRTPFDTQRLFQAGLDEIRRIIREEEPPRPSTRLSRLEASEQTTLAKRRQCDPRKLTHVLRGDLDWIVMKCLEKDRTRRYETTNGLARDIDHHLSSEPIIARPPSNLYRFQKMVRRNRLAFAASGAVCTAIIGGFVVSSWLYLRERQARAEAWAARKGEADQRMRAERQARRAEEQAREATLTLAGSDFSRAVSLIAQDRDDTALAYLVRSLKLNPTNPATATATATLLTYRSWKLPKIRLRHEAEVSSAHFSPNGDVIVTTCGDTARLWDARTGAPLALPLKHDGRVLSARFSPDGNHLVTISVDEARIWDARTGSLLVGPVKQPGGLSFAQFNPSGNLVLTGSDDGTIQIWNASSGPPVRDCFPMGSKLVAAEFSRDREHVFSVYENGTVFAGVAQAGNRRLEMQHEVAVNSAELSLDGSRIVTVSDDCMVRVWDARDGRLQLGPIKLAEQYQNYWAVRRAHFSPDGKQFLTIWGTARVWDALTGQPVTPPLRHGSALKSAEFSPDGNRIITASEDSTARVWDAHTGLPLTEPLNHAGIVTWAEFSPEGRDVLTSSSDGTACVWDTSFSEALAQPLRCTNRASSGQFSPDGKKVITGSCDGEVWIWDAMTGEPLVGPIQHGGWIWCAQFSPDGKHILTGSADGTARVWDAQSGYPVTDQIKHAGSLSHAEFSRDGTLVATASWDKTARVWNSRTGHPVTAPLEHMGPVRFINFSPDGKKVVTASHDGTARVWDARTGSLLTKPLAHQSGVIEASFSPDGTRIVTASSDNTARLWDVQTGQLIAGPLNHVGLVGGAVFSPDGARVLTASNDGTARVWDARTGFPLTEPLKHSAQVSSSKFSPDGERVLTTSDDSTARIWDSRTGEPLTDPIMHEGAVGIANFSPDGNRVISNALRTYRLWDVAPSGPAPAWLLLLAEAFSGEVVSQRGRSERAEPDKLNLLRQVEEMLRQPQQSGETWVVWGRWFLSDPATRTISPFSRTTVPQYIEYRMKENTERSLAEAARLACGNTLLLEQISAACKALNLAEQRSGTRAGEETKIGATQTKRRDGNDNQPETEADRRVEPSAAKAPR